MPLQVLKLILSKKDGNHLFLFLSTNVFHRAMRKSDPKSEIKWLNSPVYIFMHEMTKYIFNKITLYAFISFQMHLLPPSGE